MSNVAERPTESGFRIGLVRADDVGILSEVATRAYSQHFTHLWTDDGKAYAEKSFNIRELSIQLSDDENAFHLAFVDNAAVGFLKLRPNNTLAVFGAADAFEIERIYLVREAKGKGIGKAMVKLAVDQAHEMGKDLVWLKVMDSNQKTIGFYESCGFEIVGTETLDLPLLKPELAGMFVMKIDLRDQQ